MSLAEEIKKRMFAAMKAGRTIEKEILRVATGEITMTAARESRDLSDEDVQGILRKMVKSIRESLTQAPDADKAGLQEELTVIESLLPKAMSEDDIVAALATVKQQILAAAGEGPAMGIAMKVLKATNLPVEAPQVGAAIKRIRSGS